MNKQMRKELQEAQAKIQSALDLLYEAQGIIENASTEERDKFDNASEGLQATERFQQMEENADTMDELVSNLEDVVSNLEDYANDDTFDL